MPAFHLYKALHQESFPEQKKKMNEPAIANDETSSPINERIFSPTKRKTIIIINATNDVFQGECFLHFF